MKANAKSAAAIVSGAAPAEPMIGVTPLAETRS
jgi:hypothetical protein